MVSIRRKRLIAEATAEAARVEALPPIEKLQMIQEKLGKVNTEAKSKILAIEKRYTEMQKPIYNRRNEIISKIPNFWLIVFVFLKHPTLKKLLMEEDEKILEYTDSLYVENLEDDREGYCITFNFRANPYFRRSSSRVKELCGQEVQPSIGWLARDLLKFVMMAGKGAHSHYHRPVSLVGSALRWIKIWSQT